MLRHGSPWLRGVPKNFGQKLTGWFRGGGRQKNNKHEQLLGIVPEMGGGKIVYVFPLFLGKTGRNPIPKKNQQVKVGLQRTTNQLKQFAWMVCSNSFCWWVGFMSGTNVPWGGQRGIGTCLNVGECQMRLCKCCFGVELEKFKNIWGRASKNKSEKPCFTLLPCRTRCRFGDTKANIFSQVHPPLKMMNLNSSKINYPPFSIITSIF